MAGCLLENSIKEDKIPVTLAEENLVPCSVGVDGAGVDKTDVAISIVALSSVFHL